jgi:2-amino-4-hydroxy-6-hydroxymethyldihydropteridine diphosphokinase
MGDAIVAFGSNVGDARATIERAVALLCDGDDVKLTAGSSDYRTPPWGDPDQPPFINRCIAVSTALTPRELLDRGHAIEARLGRDRSVERRWGPRTIDIDVISYDDVVLDEPGLTLPHPRMFERAFVLVPIAEILPNRVVAGRRIKDALATLDQTGIERLPRRPA